MSVRIGDPERGAAGGRIASQPRGLASGGELYAAAAVATIIVPIIPAGLKRLEDSYRARVQSCVRPVRAEHEGLRVDDLKRLLRIKGGQIRRHTQVPIQNGLDDHVLPLCVSRDRTCGGCATAGGTCGG